MSTITDAGVDVFTLIRRDIGTDCTVIAATATAAPGQFTTEVGEPSAPSVANPGSAPSAAVMVATMPETEAPAKGSPTSAVAAVVEDCDVRVSSTRRGVTAISSPSVLATSSSPV